MIKKKSAAEIVKEMEYLFSKINWPKSWLDAKAVQIMNEISKDIKALEGKS